MPDHFDIDLLIRERDELREENAALKAKLAAIAKIASDYFERKAK